MRTHFVDVSRVHRRVPACPLGPQGTAVAQGEPPETACALCPFNLLAPGAPRIGCEVLTPLPLVAEARAGLAVRDSALAAELAALFAAPRVTSGRADDALAVRLLALAESWYERVGAETTAAAEAERELARLIARFARASLTHAEPVEILG
jgi:hypothetical protein